jgi:hypothetical protein
VVHRDLVVRPVRLQIPGVIRAVANLSTIAAWSSRPLPFIAHADILARERHLEAPDAPEPLIPSLSLHHLDIWEMWRERSSWQETHEFAYWSRQ